MISLFSFDDDDDGLSTLCWFLIIGVVYDDSVLSVIDEEVHRPPSDDEPSLIQCCSSSSQVTIKIPTSDVSLLSSFILTHELLLSVSMAAVAISDVSNVLHSLFLLLGCTSCVTTSWVCCVAMLLLAADVVALAASKVMVAADLVVDIVLN